MSFQPTAEQEAALAAYRTGGSMVIEAGAGTGKTSTLKLLAKENTKRKGVYLAYNRAIAQEAKQDFPRQVQCATAHSFAFREMGVRYKHRLDSPRMTARQAAGLLGITATFKFDGDSIILGPNKLARMVLDTVQQYCYSADAEPMAKHIPWVPGLELYREELAAFIVPYAKRAWADLSSKDGRLKFEHDHYLKLWALDEPYFMVDYILLDEAQDANPVIAQVFEMQRPHAQLIAVGDASQSIYGWRGAVDYMTKMQADHRLLLSQSFRFGPAVAVEANKWLTLLDAKLRLTGYEAIDSKVQVLDNPDTILCRTNAECVARCLFAQESNKKVAIVGGADSIRRFAEAATDLMAGRSTTHPELSAFKDWLTVREYVAEGSGADLKVLVNLIDDYGTEKVIQIANRCVDERDAEIVVSTAHKAKGREWKKVQIASDFREPGKDDDGEDREMARSEIMLAYVAVTRAQEVLDNTGLAWVNRLLGINPVAPTKEPTNPFTRKARGLSAR
jgi:hypothetical protein